MAELLARYRRLQTSDLDEARRRVAEVYCAHQLSMPPRRGRLDVVHNTGWIGEVGLHYLRYGEEVRITPELLATFYLVQIPLQGHARVESGSTTIHSDRHHATLLQPAERVDMVWSADCEQLIVYLPRGAVERAGKGTDTDSGDPSPVEFKPRLDLETPGLRSWMSLVDLAVEQLERDGSLVSSPSAAASLQQALVTGLLAAQPNDGQVEPVAETGTVPSLVLRSALELLDSRPEHPWRLADLADLAGASPRALQHAFRTELGTTPMAELRRVRLAPGRRRPARRPSRQHDRDRRGDLLGLHAPGPLRRRLPYGVRRHAVTHPGSLGPGPPTTPRSVDSRRARRLEGVHAPP